MRYNQDTVEGVMMTNAEWAMASGNYTQIEDFAHIVGVWFICPVCLSKDKDDRRELYFTILKPNEQVWTQFRCKHCQTLYRVSWQHEEQGTYVERLEISDSYTGKAVAIENTGQSA